MPSLVEVVYVLRVATFIELQSKLLEILTINTPCTFAFRVTSCEVIMRSL